MISFEIEKLWNNFSFVRTKIILSALTEKSNNETLRIK